MFRRILVATDGAPGALGAIRTAQLFSRRDGSRVEVISVCEPVMLYSIVGLEAMTAAVSPLTQAALASLTASVSSQLEDEGDETSEWPLRVEVGSVTPTIARMAADTDADLIVLGLAEGKGIGHWRSRETVADLVHLAHLPVLAVPPRARSLPRVAVAAIDFSEFSIRAALLAARALDPEGTIHLAHVMPAFQREGAWQPPGGWDTYVARIEQRLKQLAEQSQLPSSITVKTRVLSGVPTGEILQLAAGVQADLIASGSHGSGFFGRLLLGTVAGSLIHRADCSVLVVPPPDLPPELRDAEGVADAGPGQ